MNLPDVCTKFFRFSSIFALSCMLFTCAACDSGSSNEESSPDSSGTPAVSGEVEVTEQDSASAGTSSESGEVSDSGSAEQAASAGDAAASSEASAKPEPKRQVHVASPDRVRDPFLNKMAAVSIPSRMKNNRGVAPAAASKNGPAGKAGAPARAGAPSAKGVKGADAPPAEEVKVEKPDVKVTAIFKSGNNYSALIQGGKNAMLIKPGDVIAGYKVTNISDKNVTIVYKGKYKFVIPMEKETFGTAKAATPNRR